MVCKEDLCMWFKNLSPRSRIEYMCALLHMCLPLELRFVGTVLEYYGKKDYHYLRNDEVAANKQAEILKYRNIAKPETLRAKILVTLALMRSSSTACAQIIYEIIESKLTTVFSFGPGADISVADEILTVLTLAANHPAFMFEQKRRLHDHLHSLDSLKRDMLREKVEEEESSLDLYPDNHLPHYPGDDGGPMAVHPAALCNRHSPVPQPRKVFVQNIEVRGPRKASEKKVSPEYQIVATWSNGEATEVGKRYREIQDFHRQMIDLFPEEKPPNGRLPNLSAGSSHHSSREEHITEQIRTLSTYFRTLTSAPSHIIESDHVCQFFKGVVIRQAPPLSMLSPTVPYHHPPDEEAAANMVPQHMKSMSLRNSHLYYLSPQLNDAAAGRYRYFPPAHAHNLYIVPPRLATSNHACPTLLMPSPHIPMHQQQQPPPPALPAGVAMVQQQQPSPVSPSRSELSSTTTSPTGSRSTSPDSSVMSVTQLLKVLSLDKYSTALGGLSFEQLSSLNFEELTKLGLTPEAQHALRSKLDQINSEKQPLMNGLLDNNLFPPHWVPASFTHFRSPIPPTSPRSALGVVDASPSTMSDVASGGGISPPVSPGPAKIQGALLAKAAPPGDSSEGSEDLDRDKGEAAPDAVKSLSQQGGKSAQVKVSPGTGGSNSPRPSSANARMTPPDDTTVKQPLLPQVMPHMIPYYYQAAQLATPSPPGLMGQYVDSKGEVGLMGVVPGANSNSNNNYTTEAIPIMSTGVPQRPPLIQTGAGSVRPPFKTAQPQPAHTNMGVLHGKNLITMPTEPKPGSPFSFLNLQTPMGQAAGPGASHMEGAGAQRMPLYHMPYGRGQGGPIASAHLPMNHPSQPGLFSTLATRSVQTSLPGSASVMTVSASHPVTVVTATHSSTTTPTPVQRSPSHGSGNNQRDSGNESIGGNGGVGSEGSLRSSPLQAGGVTVTQVVSAPSPPTSQPCQCCNHAAPFSHSQYGPLPYHCPPFLLPQGPNGLIPMPGYYSHMPSVLTNGYTSDMYPYSHPTYPTLNHSSAHMYPMIQGGPLYQGTPSQPPVAAGNGGSGPPPQPLSGGGGSVGLGVQQGNGTGAKQRNTGCYNCGSLSHKAADCHESSMETMSGKSAYTLNYKPAEESD